MPAKRKTLTKKQEETNYGFVPPNKDLEFIHSGCDLLDLVLGGGYPIGRVSNIIGDSSTNKTGLTIEAIANFRKQYPDGLIWYHDAEAAFDIDYAIKLGLPQDKNTEIIRSMNGVEYTYDKIIEALNKVTTKKTRGIYVLDTLDALQPIPEDDNKDPIAKGFDNAKRAALINSFVTKITPKVEKANLHLMIVSQIRGNIGVIS